MLSRSKNKILSHNSGFTPLNPARPVRLSRNLTGFTLIELLTSVFIIALISGIFMVNYHNTNKRSELKVVAQKLVSNIRLAQNYSLGSKTYNGVDTPKGGWGAHFDVSNPTSYIIFADKDAPNGNQAYDAGEAIETKTLPAGVTINSLFSIRNFISTPVNALDIVFFPPDPVTYVNGFATDNASVELKENINNSTAAVVVNFFGLIDVE